MQITPHSGGSAPGGLGALRGGVAAPSDCGAPNGGTSAHSKHGVPRRRYVRSQHTKGTPNSGTSALDNQSSPSGGGGTSSACDTPNCGGSAPGNLRALSGVVYPFPTTLAFPAAVCRPPVGLVLLTAVRPPSWCGYFQWRYIRA
jgi:hypothetical protein